MNIEADLLKDWNHLIREELSNYFSNSEIPIDDEEAEILYFNFLRRSISIKPRTVYGASDITVPDSHSEGFRQLIQKVEDGGSLNPHLSRKRKKLKFKDGMLNDWGIHHFHLGTTSISGGLIKGTSDVLFALVDQYSFFCIGIYTHEDWSNKEVIEEVHSRFPNQISMYRLKGISDVSHDPSNEDIGDLRSAGINTIIKMDDGTIYAPPGGGYATDRTSIDVVRVTDKWRKVLRTLEDQLDEVISQRKEFSFKTDEVECNLVIDDGELCLHFPELNKLIPLEKNFPAL